MAREAADLVLLDDSFSSIVGGVRLGRRIFTNLRDGRGAAAGVEPVLFWRTTHNVGSAATASS